MKRRALIVAPMAASIAWMDSQNSATYADPKPVPPGLAKKTALATPTSSGPGGVTLGTATPSPTLPPSEHTLTRTPAPTKTPVPPTATAAGVYDWTFEERQLLD